MAVYRIHTTLDRHEGQKTGRVRSCTRGARIEAPEGEFSDLQPGRDYSRIDSKDDPDTPSSSEQTDTSE